jgi:cellulose synthase/poly-beta-1,6-N-acetylglucosamine synthase-like glycosyltransferase
MACAASGGPVLSVVMTGYTMRRLPDVLEAIESLSRQTYRDLEIIFVAEGPEELAERVETIARNMGIANLRVVRNSGPPGLTFARNVGVQYARGNLIAFFDDDAVAAPDWAEHLVKTFDIHPEAIGLTGQALPLWRGEEAPWFPDELDWILGSTRFTGWRELRAVRNALGANMAFRREAFEHCRFSIVLVGGNQGDPVGIKRGLVGDDTLFSLEVCASTGRPILFNPSVVVHNKVYPYRLKSEYVRRRAFWEGYTKATLVRSSGSDYSIRLSTETGLLRRILLCLLPRTMWQLLDRPAQAWRQLSFTVAVLFHLSLGYAAGRFPFLSRLVVQKYS